MDKYYKAEDIFALLDRLHNVSDGGLYYAIESLPTIEVSEDCISRKWLLKYITKGAGALADNTETLVDVIKHAPSVVPTTEQSSKVGEWIEVDDGRVSCKCSICKEEYLLYEEDVFGRNYCPNCGAKMKG